MNREALRKHCEKMCKMYEFNPSSDAYMEHKLVLDLLDQTECSDQQSFINKPCVSEGACREDKMQVLDKIRAELIQSIQNGVIKIESGNEELFRIIDKYRTESEE